MATILIVDDHAINREFLETLLGYAGHRVLQAADGAEALQVTRTHYPDLVISDVLMPGMDGVEFANELHADPGVARIPIIFYTATYRLTEARALAESCGVSMVLAKPSEPQAILDAVASVLGISHTTSRLPIAPFGLVDSSGEALPGHLRELTDLQKRLQVALDQGLELIGDEAVRQISDHLVQSFGTVQALSMRLAAVLELGLVLSAERNPQKVLDLFCRASRDIMSARYAAVGVLDREGQRLQFWATHGLAQDVGNEFLALDFRAGVFGEVLASDRPRRLQGNDDLRAAGLPAAHPPIKALLAVPIRTAATVRGWLYFADKLSATAFGEEDEQFGVTLAAQLALTYENLIQNEEIQRHAAQLELDLAERRHAAELLQESELRFRQLAESIRREVFFLTGHPNDETLYVSPAYEAIWGRSCESLHQEPDSWMDAVHPDDRELVIKVNAEWKKPGWIQRENRMVRPDGVSAEWKDPGWFEHEYRIVRPDGAIRWIQERRYLIYDAAGEIYRVASVAEDLTERRESENILKQRASELERFHSLSVGRELQMIELKQEINKLARQAGYAPPYALAFLEGQDAKSEADDD
jgi:CheY-like chemotaxis protein